MDKYLRLIMIIGIACCLAACLPSCAKNESVYKGVVRGMYDGANQRQEIDRKDPIPPDAEKTPSYDQYEQDRRDMIKDEDN